jgi:hypothetical protein
MSIHYLIFVKKRRIKGDRLLFELNRCNCERNVARVVRIKEMGPGPNSLSAILYFTLASNWLIFLATGLAPLS